MNDIKDIILQIEECNGKIIPKCGKKAFVINLLLDVCLIGITTFLICEILNFPNIDIKNLIPSIILIAILDYLMLLSPYQQYPEKYRIEFVNENTLNGFKLFYKNKEVKFSYVIDENEKIIFKDDNKLEYISYADSSRMAQLTKRRIINYFKSWLMDNNLMSK